MSTPRARFACKSVAVCLAAFVTASGGLTARAQGVGAGQRQAQGREGGSPSPDAAANARIIHVLNRLGYGPRPGDVDRIRQIGIETYIEQQLAPEKIADAMMAQRLERFETLGLSTAQLWASYFGPAMEVRRVRQAAAAPPAQPTPPGEAAAMAQRTPEQMEAAAGERQVLANLQQQRVLRAVYSERQLEEVMVDFWFNHFNVFVGKGPVRIHLTEYERDTIRPRVFGTFRELLGAVAESPAMLFYLDNWQSSAPAGTAARGTRARPMPNRRPSGLNENYARELMELHTLGVDGGYTQQDVQEIARAFTGWTIANPRQGGPFLFNPRMHDDGEKVVLGRKIRAGGGRKDGEQVLDILASHPATARFIATKLARRFVADDPPSALVARAAARFTATGGDIRAVVRTIVTSPEFSAPGVQRAKVKTPFEFVVSAVRAAGIETPNGMPLVQTMRGLGMPLYGCQPPTGYADRAEAWVNAGALLGRMNFAVALTSGALRGGQQAGAAMPPRRRNQDRAAATPEQIVSDVLGGSLTTATSATVARATEPAQTIALLLGSPEFQKR